MMGLVPARQAKLPLLDYGCETTTSFPASMQSIADAAFWNHNLIQRQAIHGSLLTLHQLEDANPPSWRGVDSVVLASATVSAH
jgi:hypothetical protein